MTGLMVLPISADAARPLRNAVLRPALPPETVVYPGDEEQDSYHVGAFLGDELVGVATVLRRAAPFEDDPASWQLRGMAVVVSARRIGCGRALVEACLAYVRDQDGSMIWCRARTNSVPFYQSLGFKVHGEEFEIPVSGPHYLMWRLTNEC